MLLKIANPDGGPYFRVTHFHKMMFLLYKRLKSRNLNIRLPYSWYLYGPYIDSAEYERQVGSPLSYYVPNNEDGPTRIMDNISIEGVSSNDAKLIEDETRRLVRRYKQNNRYKTNYIDHLLDDAYAYAPFEFQKAFNRGLFTIIRKLRSNDVGIEEVEFYLDRLMKIYPYDEMHELYDIFLEWDDTIRMALDRSSAQHVEKLANDFWSIYCELLHIKKNENIYDDIKEPWSFKFCENLDEYTINLENEREILLEVYEAHHLMDGVARNIAEKMNDLAYRLAIDQ